MLKANNNIKIKKPKICYHFGIKIAPHDYEDRDRFVCLCCEIVLFGITRNKRKVLDDK